MPRHIRDFSGLWGAKFESQLGKYTEKNKRNRPKLISYIIRQSNLFLQLLRTENCLSWSLSNDPDKNCSIFYCSAAIRFPHVETVVFSDQEFIDGKQVYEIKCI